MSAVVEILSEEASSLKTPLVGGRGGDDDGVWTGQFPLTARGRHIVNRHGERYKFAGVNWYGASDGLHVVGGLADRSLVRLQGV
jgi:hypothetical protein